MSTLLGKVSRDYTGKFSQQMYKLSETTHSIDMRMLLSTANPIRRNKPKKSHSSLSPTATGEPAINGI